MVNERGQLALIDFGSGVGTGVWVWLLDCVIATGCTVEFGGHNTQWLCLKRGENNHGVERLNEY